MSDALVVSAQIQPPMNICFDLLSVIQPTNEWNRQQNDDDDARRIAQFRCIKKSRRDILTTVCCNCLSVMATVLVWSSSYTRNSLKSSSNGERAAATTKTAENAKIKGRKMTDAQNARDERHSTKWSWAAAPKSEAKISSATSFVSIFVSFKWICVVCVSHRSDVRCVRNVSQAKRREAERRHEKNY